MNTLKRFSLFAALLGLIATLPAFAQTYTLTQTTTTAAIAVGDTVLALTSVTGISAPTTLAVGTRLMIDQEIMDVKAISSLNVTVGRVPSRNAAHVSGAIVYAGAPNLFYSVDPPLGACTLTSTFVTPWINNTNGNIWNCNAAGRWQRRADFEFYVPPTQCTFFPTTLTQTSTYPFVGASNVFVLNSTTNAATGTLTLSCNILVPSRVTATRGAVITDVTLFVGSQTTAPSALGTATLATITFPAAATTETASTVTPVTIGGTVTTVSPTQLTTVTTAGAFLTTKHTFSTAVDLSTDLRILQFTLPFTNGSAAAMTINTPGLIVHGYGAQLQ